ncbi:MAG: hypothetical protein OEN00_01265 [Gemmatimonadota bacterium]|nr:hypothetical protein [Gemmatimonadota bacterium]
MSKYSHAAGALSLAAFAFIPAFGAPIAAQSASESIATSESESQAAVLEREYPDFYDLLIRLERAHGLLFGGLFEEGEIVRANGDGLPTFEFEFDIVDRLTRLTAEEGRADHAAEEAAAGFAVLGAKAAEVIAWGNEFYRDVMGVLVDPSLTVFAERRAAVAQAVERYQSRPDIALPTRPKEMDVLYDHPYAFQFRGGYADLGGVIWAGYWLKLAATEPITDFPEKEVRQAGIDTVTNRYHLKLSYGEPPEFFPSEIPLAPAICPGMIFLGTEASMIMDNLSFMQEVFADILASPDVPDVHAALDEALDQFLDPEYRITTRDDWESMALQHGIFFQGGFPLGVMTKSELNVDSHAAHFGGSGRPVLDPTMPR